MYINHRPAFGLDPYQIYDAFRLINQKYTDQDDSSIQRHIFLNEMQTRGEHMTDYELADCLSNLMHANQAVDELPSSELTRLIDKHLPEEISVDKFMTEIIGVPTDDFDTILQTWERIRQSNTPRVNQSKKLLEKKMTIRIHQEAHQHLTDKIMIILLMNKNQ